MSLNLVFSLVLLAGGSGMAYYLTIAAREAIDAWNFDETVNFVCSVIVVGICLLGIFVSGYSLFRLSVSS